MSNAEIRQAVFDAFEDMLAAREATKPWKQNICQIRTLTIPATTRYVATFDPMPEKLMVATLTTDADVYLAWGDVTLPAPVLDGMVTVFEGQVRLQGRVVVTLPGRGVRMTLYNAASSPATVVVAATVNLGVEMNL